MARPFVVAEAGVNHNGDRDMALRLIDAAAQAGADAVKFQTFKADRLATENSAKAPYQERSTGSSESQYEMLRRLELSWDDHFALKRQADACGLVFLSSPFDIISLDFLVEELGLGLVKVSSGELTNGPLLHACARHQARLILSTGMSTTDDIQAALGVLAHGYVGTGEPGEETFEACYSSAAGKSALRDKVTLLQCTSEYPAPPERANLRVMSSLAAGFGLEVGYSDHTPGTALAIAAAALGATVIEKHFTLDRGLPGPDHRASLEPGELAAMVRAVREVTLALGDGTKAITPEELANAAVVRKGLVATGPVRAGERFTEANLGALRGAGGISPMAYWRILGQVAFRDYAAGEPITWQD